MSKQGLLARPGKWFGDLSFSAKLLVFVLGPLVLMLVVTLTLTTTGINRLEDTNSKTGLEGEVKIINGQIAQFESNLTARGSALAADPVLLDAVQRGDQTALQNLLLSASIRNNLNHIQVVDKSGRTIGVVQSFVLKGTAPKLEQLHARGLLEIEQTGLAPTPAGWLLVSARPLKGPTGLVGALSVGQLLNASTQSAWNFGRSDPLLTLFDAEGNIQTLPEAEGQKSPPPLFVVDRNLWSRALAGQQAVGTTSVGGKTYQIAYAPLMVGGKREAVYSVALSSAAAVALRDQLVSTTLLTVGGVAVLASLLTLFTGRRYVIRPLAALAASAKQIAAGHLDVSVPTSMFQDEVAVLTNTFNSMTAQLRQTLNSLEQRTVSLAQRGEELEKLNRDLQITTHQAEHRAAQLAARGQVARAASQIRDLDQLLPQVTRLISEAFGYYHVGIFIVDETSRFAVLRAANSEGGQRMLARNHKLAVGTQGIVGYVVGAGQPRVALDAGADAAHFDNPDLPETRSEIALPLQSGGQTFGALDVQSTQVAAFAEEDVAILGMLADQVAIAIENARLFAQTQSALQEAEKTQRRYQRQEWERLMPALQATSHEYHASGVPTVGDAPLPEIEQAIQQSDVVKITSQAAARSALAVPIKLRDQLIGVIDLHETEAEREWTADDVALVMAVADQAALALENARLLEQTQQRARREQLVTQIATKVRVAADVEGILRTGVQEIRRVLGASHGIVHLTTESLISKTGEARAASAESQEGNSEVVTQ